MERRLWALTETELASGRLITARCARCGGTGRVVLEQFSPPREEDCVCRWQADHRLAEAGFAERLRDKTLADIVWERLQPESLAAGVRDYAGHLETYGADGVEMVLFGKVGNGKTHLALGLGKIACGLGHRVVFVSLADTLEAVRATYDRGPGAVATPENPLERLFEVDWLILILHEGRALTELETEPRRAGMARTPTPGETCARQAGRRTRKLHALALE